MARALGVTQVVVDGDDVENDAPNEPGEDASTLIVTVAAAAAWLLALIT